MKRRSGVFLAGLFSLLFITTWASAQPYSYDDNGDYPPPVVYRRVYRRPRYYNPPAWASPNAAALAPWPWNFNFGGGPTAVTGSNGDFNGGSNFTIGGGYNFSPRTGFVIEFMNSWLGMTDQELAKNNAIDGNASLWSVTFNPVYRFRLGGPIGAYIIGGGGYYERDLTFIQEQEVNDPFFGPILVDDKIHQDTGAGGINAGLGLTWNLGWGTKFFMEARYHYVFTPGDGTQIIPITFGLRW